MGGPAPLTAAVVVDVLVHHHHSYAFGALALLDVSQLLLLEAHFSPWVQSAASRAWVVWL